MAIREVNLERLCLMALAVIAIAMVGGYAIMHHALTTSQFDARRINLAGRQRMLSVQLVKLAYESQGESLNEIQQHAAMEQIRETARTLRQSHFGLIHGDASLGLGATTDPSERSALEGVETSLDSMLDSAGKIFGHDHAADWQTTIQELRQAQAEFLPAMNRIVFRLGRNANRRIETDQRIGLLIVAGKLLTLILVGFFIFRPATKQVRHTIALLKHREAELIQSEQRHRDLVKYSAGAILCLHPETGRISDVNPAGASQLSHLPEKLIGKRFGAFLDEQSAEMFGDQISRLGLDESTQCRLSILVDEGRRDWLVRLTSYQRDDGATYIMMTAHDITDQAERERALVENNQRDALTGLLNRGEFDRRIDQMAQLHHSRGVPFTLALIDIDRFKTINDQFGHQAGDAVLRTVAQIVESACRAADVVARYGGEEIAVLFPSLGLKDAKHIAERIRTALEKADIIVDGADESVTVHATISIGLAGAPSHSNRPDRLIGLADGALYRAKRQGRNVVVIADFDDPAEDADTAEEAVATTGTNPRGKAIPTGLPCPLPGGGPIVNS